MSNNMNNERNPFVEAFMKPMEEEIKKAYDEIDNCEKNGVRYVNTTHKEFIKLMSERHQDTPNFNLSTRKVTEYKCDLGPGPDDASKDWGAIYLFPHYLIESPKYRIEPDIQDTDLVDITYICTYNELITVLIDKEDMSCPGFRRFILDTLDNMLHTVNGCKIPKTRDPENYVSYRQLMTMICFINKYNEYLRILPYRFKTVLVHIIGDNDERKYRVYAIVIIPDTVIRGKNIAEKIMDNKENQDNIKYAMDYDGDTIVNQADDYFTNMIKKTFTDTDKRSFDDSCRNWKHMLRTMVNIVNNEIKNGCPIANVWDTESGKTLKNLADFIFENAQYIAELTKEDVEFTVNVTKDYNLALTFSVDEDDDDDEVKYVNPGDGFGTFHHNKTKEEADDEE